MPVAGPRKGPVPTSWGPPKVVAQEDHQPWSPKRQGIAGHKNQCVRRNVV